MDRRCCNCYKDLLPLMVLVGNESIIIGVYTLFKAATLQGMSKYVFVAYSYTVSTILLLPLYFFYTRTTQAKVWGSIVSISGAFIVTFYKGKSIIIAQDSSSPHLQQSNHILTSVDTNWVIGGLLLALSNILLTIWFVAQVEIMKEIEDELTLVFVHNLFTTILALIVGLLA
ncbi:unnamed protein product [Vicia faba]|uniref:WAT1-related protein n=1 Tax=Vicia faba TaxID=3906 RepID=A0AAV0Z881_VICFA|nr:unnamed protein product [Vicia faba]